MEQRILQAKERVFKANNFTFSGEKASLEVGHITSMASQMEAMIAYLQQEIHEEDDTDSKASPSVLGQPLMTERGQVEVCSIGLVAFEWDGKSLKIFENEMKPKSMYVDDEKAKVIKPEMLPEPQICIERIATRYSKAADNMSTKLKAGKKRRFIDGSN